MPDDFAQIVKSQVDIVRILGDYVKLRKAGATNHTGLCPFHQEKSPSFSVNSAKGFYYCFGCKATGDVFSFVMKLDAITFPEAVRAVALKAGIPLPRRDFNSPQEAAEAGLRKQLVDLHEAATQYFEAALKSPLAAQAREYLTTRGVTPETVARFRIGFAPDDFNDMRERLKPHFSEDAMRSSGLFNSQEKTDDGVPTGPLYARFRKRITFPIANEQGKPIAFTARALSATDDKGRDIAKYMNSPETPLYTKGHVLFNLDKAKADMRSHDFALLVEGQMDCISVFMAGVRNVIATSGTAFTEHQIRLLARFTHRVVVNFDPDQAGSLAAEKSISMLTEEGFEVKVISLPGGLDPDRFVREHGIHAYMDALRTAKRHSDYLIDRAMQLHPGRTADSKTKAMNFLLPHIRRMPSSMHREEFVENAIQKLSIDATIFRQEVRQAAAQKLQSIPQQRSTPIYDVERVLLRALVLPDQDPARQAAAHALAEHPDWYAPLGSAPLLEALAHAPAPPNPLDAAPDDQTRNILARVLTESDPEPQDGRAPGRNDRPTLLHQVENALSKLETRQLERRTQELRRAIDEAHRRADQDMEDQLLRELMALNKRLRRA